MKKSDLFAVASIVWFFGGLFEIWGEKYLIALLFGICSFIYAWLCRRSLLDGD